MGNETEDVGQTDWTAKYMYYAPPPQLTSHRIVVRSSWTLDVKQPKSMAETRDICPRRIASAPVMPPIAHSSSSEVSHEMLLFRPHAKIATTVTIKCESTGPDLSKLQDD